MKKYLAAALLALGCARPLPPPPSTPASPSHVEDAERLASKTVALVGLDDEGHFRPYCSGVWVSEYEILTAHHCVEDAVPGVTLRYVVRDDVYNAHDEQLFVWGRPAQFVVAGANHDLAMLRALAPPVHITAYPAGGRVRQGAFVQTMGHPLGLWWSYSSGSVAAVRQAEVSEMDCLWIQAAISISPGNSGGGLFDEDGYLVGLAHASYASPRAQQLNLFVHRDYIAEFLKKNLPAP